MNIRSNKNTHKTTTMTQSCHAPHNPAVLVHAVLQKPCSSPCSRNSCTCDKAALKDPVLTLFMLTQNSATYCTVIQLDSDSCFFVGVLYQIYSSLKPGCTSLATMYCNSFYIGSATVGPDDVETTQVTLHCGQFQHPKKRISANSSISQLPASV